MSLIDKRDLNIYNRMHSYIGGFRMKFTKKLLYSLGGLTMVSLSCFATVNAAEQGYQSVRLHKAGYYQGQQAIHRKVAEVTADELNMHENYNSGSRVVLTLTKGARV